MAELIPLVNKVNNVHISENETNIYPDQRSIILVGETGAGKSSFGNFVLRRNRFVTGDSMLSTTQKLECESLLYTENNANIQIHLLDMPGLNDPRMLDTAHLTNTYNSLKNSANDLCCLFAIIIDPSDEDELDDGVNTILEFLNKWKFPDFDLTENAIVVFTHADKLGKTLNEQTNTLYSITDRSLNLHKLLTGLRSRLLLVNSLNFQEDQYWQRIMEELIEFCIPKFNVLLIGPHESAKNDLLALMNAQIGDYVVHNASAPHANTNLDNLSIVYEKKHLSLDKINTSDVNAMKHVTTALLTPGTISTFCIVIQCKKLKSTFFSNIDKLAISLTDNNPDLFYKCCFILFLHNNDENILDKVNGAINSLDKLKALLALISNRYLIFNCSHNVAQPIYNITSCLEMIFQMSRTIKLLIYDDKYLEELLNNSFDDQNHDNQEIPGKNNEGTSISNYRKRGILGLAIGGTALITVGLGAAALGTAGLILTAPAAPVVAPLILFSAPVASPLFLASAPVSVPLLSAGSVAVGAIAAGIGATGAGVVSSTIALCTQFYDKLTKGKENEKSIESDDAEFEYDFDTEKFSILKTKTEP